LSVAAGDREEILIAKCDLRKIDEIRESWPFFRDRRIDAYSSLQSRFIDSPDRT
jgi:N-carbamoylputrescine amidase